MLQDEGDLCVVEYIWIDGGSISHLRSKTKIMFIHSVENVSIFPDCAFDGSSTYQANVNNSDAVLKPVNYVKHPFVERGYLVLCEVLNQDLTEHISNNRSQLRNLLNLYQKEFLPWLGFEQEYVIIKNSRPLGWPEHGFPRAQGDYYCAVGSCNVAGRNIADMHRDACLKAGILYYGMNAEVMLGQWEFQIGYRGIQEQVDPVNVSDHLWFARWILYRIGENFNVDVSFAGKEIKGDQWNGSGLHVNVSTAYTRQVRESQNFKLYMKKIMDCLSLHHKEDIKSYGKGLEDRLTGKNETSHIEEFVYDLTYPDRNGSVRVPLKTLQNNSGYIEDRRPSANADPYLVALSLIRRVCVE